MITDERLAEILRYEHQFPKDEKIILAQEVKLLRSERDALKARLAVYEEGMPPIGVLINNRRLFVGADEEEKKALAAVVRWVNSIAEKAGGG